VADDDDAVERLLDEAETHLRALGHPDPAFVFACVVEALAIEWADDHRAICPACAKRRCNRGQSICFECSEMHERQLLWKRNWWNKSGNEWRAERQAQQEANDQ